MYANYYCLRHYLSQVKMSSVPNIDEPLYEDDNLIFMSDNDEASDSSGTVDDDLLSLG